MANKNMNFSVDLLPSSNNTYYLGSSDKKWNLYVNQINGVSPVTGVKGNAETNYRTGQVNLTAANIGAIAKNETGNTQQLVRPVTLNGVNDLTIQSLINDVRANRLAFLPPDQIIIEKTTDGGATWVSGGFTDAQKANLFSEKRETITLPLLNGKHDTKCGIRITITAMKYNVPDNTPETQKYNYWNSTYVKSYERYCQLKNMYFWVTGQTNGISIKIERATGANSTNWYVCVSPDPTTYNMIGWSGNNFISFSQGVFGGSVTQTGNYWNYRITLMTVPKVNNALQEVTSAQAVYEIRGYGDTWWNKSNEYMASDHLYTWDYNKNATFPANITASSFIGSGALLTNLNASNLSGTVPIACIQDASTSQKGVVQLSSATNSTSTSLAATASAVKAAYDLADGKVSKSGDLMTGNLRIHLGDTDKYLMFDYDDDDTAGASWRIAALGSGNNDTNYFVIQSGTSSVSATAWNNAIRIGQNTFDTGFGGNVYPLQSNQKTLGTSSNKWANVYATTFTGSLEGNASTASMAAIAKHASAAHYSTTNSSNNSGIIKVKIKKQMAWMLTFTLRVYQAYHYTDYIISGYNYNSNHWYLPKVYLLSSSDYTKKTVTFGYDNDANSNNYCTLWVSIPRDQYTGADVFNVTNGFTQIEDLSDAFEIIYEAESTGTIQTTVEAYRPLLYNEKASSATTADSATSMTGTLGIDHGGTGATTAAGARTNLGLGTMATQSSSDYVAKSGDTVTGDILGNATATLGSTANPFHQLVLGGATTNSMTATSTNPRITFAEGTSGSQPVHIIYTDYDSYRAPAGLKVIGNQSDPAWFEVEGNVYAAAFKGNADTATAFSSNKSITLTGDVTGSASSTGGWSIATTLADSGATAGSYGPNANAEPGYGSTFNVPYITVDAKGRVTAISTKTVKIPASDNSNTLNTAGSTNTASKIFLVGATSQTSSAQTYSHTYVFETDGALSAKTLGVNYGTAANKVTMQWNNTDESLDFVFA